MRIFRLVATPILLLGLLAFLAWGAYWGWKNVTAPLPTPEPTPCVTISDKSISVLDLTVRVYNGGFQSGLAHRVSTQLRDVGMRVLKTDNTEERVNGTVIRAGESSAPAVRLLASYFVTPTIEYDDRIDGTFDILIGTDWPGFAPETQFVSQINPGPVCLAPSPSPTASPTPTRTP